MKLHDKVRVFRLDVNEQTHEQRWVTAINKGVVMAIGGSHAKVWDVSEPGINVSPYNAEWFPFSARRIKVEPA
jgi:hypothetical protein